eukprot:860680-Rhodomonas_salina.2
MLFNLGALKAFSLGCDHLVFHDVDQLPTNPENDYHYTGEPVHLCSKTTQKDAPETQVNQSHVGGALIMSWSDYKKVNGFSNGYWRSSTHPLWSAGMGADPRS